MPAVPTVRARLLALCLLSILLLGGCSWLSRFSVSPPPFGRSDWIRLEDAGVVTDPAPALAVTLINRRNRRLWIRMNIDELGGRNDCTNAIVLEPEGRHRYVCPQASVTAGTRYRSEVRVFTDRGATRIVEETLRHVQILEDAEGELVLAGRPARR